jgi:biotin-dependent carboxylase-like uncharacterized protein
MNLGLRVLAPGLHTTVQDLGRFGYRSVGVPVSGPLDRVALTLANALVGNAANTSALELLVQGPALEVMAASIRLALVGGAGGLVIEGARSRTVGAGQSVRLRKGERVNIGAIDNVACAYLAIEGGFNLPPCLGSAATYARGQFGGLKGRTLEAGDELPIRLDEAPSRPELALARAHDPGLDQPIRVVLGPQRDHFTDQALHTLVSATFAVSSRADRMGFRLDGPQLAHAKDYNIVSDGIATGSIQVPGSGQAIVLLVDAQTTGGYPKIATVISADIPAIGRRRPGNVVRFLAVTQEQAEAIRREQEETIAQWIGSFRTIDAAAEVDIAALYGENLVGGVTNALD